MASSMFLFTFVILATFSSGFAASLPLSTNTTAFEASPNVTTLPSTTTELPAFPAMVNSYFLQPLVNFNNRVSQAANSMPDQFMNSGKSLGSALVVPIQFGANMSNSMLSNLNLTVLSLSKAVHPILTSPLTWMVNTSMGNMTLNAFNYSVSQLGNGINTFGGSVSNAGDRLQNKGHNVVDWVKALDEAMRQLNSSISLSNITSFPTQDMPNLTTGASTLQV